MEEQTRTSAERLETIVIEDNPLFLETAKKAFSKVENRSFHYFSSYEDVMKYISSGTKTDQVVSDLFFPSEQNHRIGGEYGVEENIPSKDNPSGLGIVKYCIEQNIPIILVSQGDRHIGDFGNVREWLYETNNFFRKHMFSHQSHTDNMFLYSGSGNIKVTGDMINRCNNEEEWARLVGDKLLGIVDKSLEQTWMDALEGNNPVRNNTYITLLHLAKKYE